MDKQDVIDKLILDSLPDNWRFQALAAALHTTLESFGEVLKPEIITSNRVVSTLAARCLYAIAIKLHPSEDIDFFESDHGVFATAARLLNYYYRHDHDDFTRRAGFCWVLPVGDWSFIGFMEAMANDCFYSGERWWLKNI